MPARSRTPSHGRGRGTGAVLDGANLTYADLVHANLTNATLAGANLTGAVLVRADLTGADLADAILTGANLTDTNLTGTKGLRPGIRRSSTASMLTPSATVKSRR
jgi:uncharacterized protein YjbI with pentapeptide repeats